GAASGNTIRIEQPFPAGTKPLVAKLRQGWAPIVVAEAMRSHHLRLDPYAGLSLRQHSLSGGSTIAAGFAGTALGVDAEYSLGSLGLLGAASYTTWNFSEVTVARPGGGTAKGGGGATLAASLGASYPLLARPGGGLDGT